jgi:hypothetical protein
MSVWRPVGTRRRFGPGPGDGKRHGVRLATRPLTISLLCLARCAIESLFHGGEFRLDPLKGASICSVSWRLSTSTNSLYASSDIEINTIDTGLCGS